MMTTNPNVNPRKFREFLVKMVRRINHRRATVHVDYLDHKTDDIYSFDFSGTVEMGYDDSTIWIKCGNSIPVYFAVISTVTDFRHCGNQFIINDLHETVKVIAKS